MMVNLQKEVINSGLPDGEAIGDSTITLDQASTNSEETSHDDSKEIIAGYEKKIHDLEGEISLHDLEYKALRQKYDALQATTRGLEVALAEGKSRAADFCKQRDEYQEQVEKGKIAMDVAIKEKTVLEKEVARLQMCNHSLEATVRNIDTPNEKYEERIKALEKELREAKKIKAAPKESASTHEKLVISDKRNTDFIKVIYGLYSLNVFVKQNGLLPTKKEVMSYFSSVLDGKIKNWPVLLSKSKDADNNCEVFEDMTNNYKKYSGK